MKVLEEPHKKMAVVAHAHTGELQANERPCLGRGGWPS